MRKPIDESETLDQILGWAGAHLAHLGSAPGRKHRRRGMRCNLQKKKKKKRNEIL